MDRLAGDGTVIRTLLELALGALFAAAALAIGYVLGWDERDANPPQWRPR